MAGSPRILALPTTDRRQPAAVLASVKDEPSAALRKAPSLTAAARDGDGNMRSGRKNARGAGRTKEWNDKGRQKWRDTLTKKAPYKPYAGKPAVRFGGRGGPKPLPTLISRVARMSGATSGIRQQGISVRM